MTVSGLLGGHSGAEIDKGRANANTMMGRVLYRLAECVEFTVASIAGGQADNAIPKSCEATLVLTADQKGEAEACVQKLQKELARRVQRLVMYSGHPDRSGAWGTSGAAGIFL